MVSTYVRYMFLLRKHFPAIHSPAPLAHQVLRNDESIPFPGRLSRPNCQHPLPQCLLPLWGVLCPLPFIPGLVEVVSA